MYKLAIFDFDGTLVDSAPGIVDVMRQCVLEYKFTETVLEQWQNLIGVPLLKQLETILPSHAPEIWQEVANRYREIYDHKAIAICPPFPGLMMMLDLLKVFKYDYCAIIEPCLDNKLEMNVSVLEDLEPQASVVEIPVSSSDQGLSYEDKYMRGGGSKKTGPASQGMASLTRVIDPVDLAPTLKETARDYAVRAFKALGCAGVARIDFMLDLEKNILYFNEINTLPGSLAFYLWMNSHPPVLYTDMLTKMISRAQARHDRKLSLHREIGFKALFK